jgi:hypothetical protein
MCACGLSLHDFMEADLRISFKSHHRAKSLKLAGCQRKYRTEISDPYLLPSTTRMPQLSLMTFAARSNKVPAASH